MKRILSLLICFCLVLCLSACKKDATDSQKNQNTSSNQTNTVAAKNFSLLCCHSDSFNPYLAKTSSNRQLSFLLYDSLVKVDNNFEPIYVLAQSVEVKENLCTVTLKNASFTDGSAVTANDVIYSYNLAKESSQYMHNLYEVVAVNANGEKQVVFELSKHDPYFANLLNFPILKTDSSGVTDSDGKEIYPIGCGRYILSKDKLTLTQNQNYFGKKGSIKTIDLINSPDQAATSHYVEIGAVDAYYTNDERIVRMSGKKLDVNLNRLIYIGINEEYAPLASKEIRYAISSAIDRSAISHTAYYNQATPATGFFNPYFKATQAVQTVEENPNSKITVENLSKIGYNNMNSNGYYANSEGKNPVFTLLVNSENLSRVSAAELIAEQCREAGIQIEIEKCSYEQYLERLKSGSFQLYVGEVEILNNMDFTQLVTSGGSAAYGIAKKETEEESQTQTSEPTTQPSDTPVVEEPLADNEAQDVTIEQNYCEVILNSYFSGDCNISDVASTLLTEMPQIPICYLSGIMFYNSAIRSGVESSIGDIYLNIENYEF